MNIHLTGRLSKLVFTHQKDFESTIDISIFTPKELLLTSVVFVINENKFAAVA